MTPARLRWGLLFIASGVLFLLQNTGVINSSLFVDLSYYFPIFLIALGIEKIFTRTRLEAVSYLTIVALFTGGVFVSVESYNSSSYANADGIKIDPTINAIYAVLNFKYGDLEIRDSRPGKVQFKFNRLTPTPRIKTVTDGDRLNIYLDSRQSRFWAGALQFDYGDPDDWKIAFARDVPLSLVCNGDESEMYLNLATTPLRDLEVKADDAKVTVRIGDLEPYVTLRLRGDESVVRLRVPVDLGFRVTGVDDEEYLSRIGLVRARSGFVNAGFDTLKKSVDVDLDDRFRSLSIEFY